MVLHSRDPALLFPDNTKRKPAKKPCEHVLPGSQDCQDQIEKNKCAFQQQLEPCECTGKVHAACADVEKGKRFVAIKKLEDYRSTEKGLGHLSDRRAVHSSPVPFR